MVTSTTNTHVGSEGLPALHATVLYRIPKMEAFLCDKTTIQGIHVKLCTLSACVFSSEMSNHHLLRPRACIELSHVVCPPGRRLFYYKSAVSLNAFRIHLAGERQHVDHVVIFSLPLFVTGLDSLCDRLNLGDILAPDLGTFFRHHVLALLLACLLELVL